MWMFVVGAVCSLISVLVGFGMGVYVSDRSSKNQGMVFTTIPEMGPSWTGTEEGITDHKEQK